MENDFESVVFVGKEKPKCLQFIPKRVSLVSIGADNKTGNGKGEAVAKGKWDKTGSEFSLWD